MRARATADYLATADGARLQKLVRDCVHCGFCNATCPTYQLRRDELDGPRGRIYLVKALLEGEEVGQRTQLHLDRCLTCRSCETTCPSGVQYGRLVELARPLVDVRVPRGRVERLKRWAIRTVVPRPRLFGAFVRLGRLFAPLLPDRLKTLVPAAAPAPDLRRPPARHSRRMVLLEGCAQAACAPEINAAAARVFDRGGISLASAGGAGCCGAVPYHLGDVAAARACARRNLDAWREELEAGAEAVLSTASGCTVMLREYAELLADEPAYAALAERVATAARDPIECLPEAAATTDGATARSAPALRPLAIHTPCTLQHGLQLGGRVERLFRDRGFELTMVADPHLCCGSAGSYSLLQPALSEQLLAQRVAALEAGAPAVIVTANIGCLLHLRRRAGVPVRHWLEVFDEAAGRGPSEQAAQ